MREILFPPSAMPVCSRVFFDAAKECGLVRGYREGGKRIGNALGVSRPRFPFFLDSINFPPTSFVELENSFRCKKGKNLSAGFKGSISGAFLVRTEPCGL